ncbi:MAG: hypothetical protein VX304_00125 [Planctomycetota bacterium]|nr:hypothetical protein [Planctomycetota bacterium]
MLRFTVQPEISTHVIPGFSAGRPSHLITPVESTGRSIDDDGRRIRMCHPGLPGVWWPVD